MDLPRRLRVLIAAIIIVGTTVGMSHATGGPTLMTFAESLVSGKQTARTISTPTPSADTSSVGDEMIYSVVGPNAADPVVKSR